MPKSSVDELALFGGEPEFRRPLSTSNLDKPDFEKFLSYSRVFFDQHRYSNTGPLSVLLEERLAAFHDVPECVAVTSGFWSLVLAVYCLGLPGRIEVVMPSLTYRRMADAVRWAGFEPRFCEVDRDSLAVTAETVAPHLSDRTALILGAHAVVRCCDARGLEELSSASGVPLLVDSVEATYGVLEGRRVGAFGEAEIFSLHASKLINAMEGGYVTTRNPDLADRLRLVRAFGFRGQDNVEELGLNAKLNEVHAAMALAGLDAVDHQVEVNRMKYDAFARSIRDVPGIRLVEFDATERPAYKNIVVELTADWPLSRELTLSALNAEMALARAYYDPPLHTVGRGAGPVDALPVTTELARRFVCMPCGYQVSSADLDTIAELMAFMAVNAAEITTRRAA